MGITVTPEQLAQFYNSARETQPDRCTVTTVALNQRFSLTPNPTDFVINGATESIEWTGTLFQVELPDGRSLRVEMITSTQLSAITPAPMTLNGVPRRRPLFVGLVMDAESKEDLKGVGCRLHYVDLQGKQHEMDLYRDVDGPTVYFLRQRGVSYAQELWQLGIAQPKGKTLIESIAEIALEAEFYLLEPTTTRRRGH